MSAFVPKWTSGDWTLVDGMRTMNVRAGGETLALSWKATPEDMALMACSKRLAERLLEHAVAIHDLTDHPTTAEFQDCPHASCAKTATLLRECGAIP